MEVQVIDFKEVKDIPYLRFAIMQYGLIVFNIRIMYRKTCGSFIEFTRTHIKNHWVHCCETKEKVKREEFQLIVIHLLTVKLLDVKRVIDSKLKKIVQ